MVRELVVVHTNVVVVGKMRDRIQRERYNRGLFPARWILARPDDGLQILGDHTRRHESSIIDLVQWIFLNLIFEARHCSSSMVVVVVVVVLWIVILSVGMNKSKMY